MNTTTATNEPTAPAPPRATPRRVIADLLEQLGDIPPDRVRLHPWPGTATEQDVLEAEAEEGRLCELVDGVLVEKAMGYDEGLLAALLIHYLTTFVLEHNLGQVVAPDSMIRLFPGLVRLPDVAFSSWDRVRQREDPPRPIARIVPDLVVEILSECNTRREMERKLREYFDAGVRLAWYADPRTRTVRVYTRPDECVTLGEDQALDGGDVLPGFRLDLRTWFEQAAYRGPET